MKIIETLPGDPHFHLFNDLPKQLYPADSIRHKQAESFNMAFLQSCFVMIKDGNPLARAALYNNPNLIYQGLGAACVGNYESVDNSEVANTLLTFVAQKAKKTGAAYLIGPMNGSTWDHYRFSTHHQYANFLLEPFHHLYYNNHFQENGFEIIANYASAIDQEIVCDYPDVLNREQEIAALGVQIRSIRMDDFETELKKLYPFISTTFKDNFLYSPISWEGFRAKYMEAAKIINPEFVLIAEDKQENIIGFIFCYDDLFNTVEKSLVIKTLARDTSGMWSGLGHVLNNLVIREAKKKGYRSIIHAFMIVGGNSNIALKKYQSSFFKNYVLYGKGV